MSSRHILVLSRTDVEAITSHLPPPQILETIKSVLCFVSKSHDSVQSTPSRSTIESSHHTTLFMPSRVEALSVTAIKVVAVPKGGAGGGIPATSLVMDETTGGVDAVVNARSLTALRTAAVSTLATKLCLGTTAKPTHLLLFGAGAQSDAHATLLIAAFSTIKHCTVINRSRNTRLTKLLESFRARFPGVDVVGLAGDDMLQGQNNTDIERAVKSASIICTATSSTEPLFPADWVSPGTHINLVGSYTPLMHEVSSDLIKRAKIVIVDSRAACAREAGELITAGIAPEETHELGELADGSDIPTASTGNISVFKTVGVGVLDVAIARLVVEKARELGCGTSIPFD